MFPNETDRISGEIVAGRPPDLMVGDEQVLSLAIRVNPEFQRPGRYTAIMRLDGVDMKRADFRVVTPRPA